MDQSYKYFHYYKKCENDDTNFIKNFETFLEKNLDHFFKSNIFNRR